MALLANALTTVARLCEFMDMDVPAQNSVAYTALEAYINSMTGWIEKYLGFRPKQTAYTNEEYDTQAADCLVLKNFPISSGENFTLQRRDNALNEDDWETVDGQYYHVDYESGIVYGAGGWKFSQTRKGYRVSYTAGYNYDNASTYLSDTAGGGIELACWLLCQDMYSKKGTSADIQSERIGQYQVTYVKSSLGGQGVIMQNAKAQELLDGYARTEMVGVITPPHY